MGVPYRQLLKLETAGFECTILAFGHRRDVDRLVPLVAEATSEGHSVLVFCSSRKQCESAAALIADLLPQVGVAAGSQRGFGLLEQASVVDSLQCASHLLYARYTRLRTAACCHSLNALLFALQIAPPPAEKQAELAVLRQGITADIKIAMGAGQPIAGC